MSSYHWTVSGGSIQGAADGQSVTVQAGNQCNGTLTLTLDVTNATSCTGRGSKTVNVRDTQAPVISGVGGLVPGAMTEANLAPMSSAVAAVD